MKPDYPKTKKTDFIELLHGIEVPDPYRWMENIDSPETKEWIEAQNQLTQSYLSEIRIRNEIRQRMTELWDYEKFGIPECHNGRYFYAYNTG
ncbi:MAG: hypothetical protein MUO40_02250, partial [Anaerolineaceae bacterium]|nr:hypothetical protein [Anaerolineaceae bacterium]